MPSAQLTIYFTDDNYLVYLKNKVALHEVARQAVHERVDELKKKMGGRT